jgi:hypothetical protein
MKKVFTSIWIIGMLSISVTAAPIQQFTLWENRAIQLMQPYTLQLGLQGIRILKSSDDPDNMGCIELQNKWAEISIGSAIFKNHSELTEDGYAAILCHELGHVFAGAPLYLKDGANLSTEGQSDYWAAAVCLKKLFTRYPRMNSAKPNPYLVTNCDSQFASKREQRLCYRIAAAGMNVMTVLHRSLIDVIQNDPVGFYKKPDFSIKETLFSDRYPTLQCRAETYAAGAFCKSSDIKWSNGVINWNCEDEISKRPSCWFKP